MNRSVVVLILAFLFTAPLAGLAESQELTVTPEWVLRFEQSLDINETLKNDSSYDRPLSLESYARYYEVDAIDGVKLVRAVFAPPIERYPDDWTSCTYGASGLTDCRPVTQRSEDVLRRRGRGVHLDEPAPEIADGGCGVISLLIDPATLRVLEAWCNGVA